MNSLIVLLLFLLSQGVLSSVDEKNFNRLKYDCLDNDCDCVTRKYDVDLELCGAKKCIFKCCPEGEVVELPPNCVPMNSDNFSNITVYDYYLNAIKNRKFYDIFFVIPNKFKNKEFANSAYNAIYIKNEVFLEESGVLYIERPNHYNRWMTISELCIDYELSENNTLSPEPYFWVNYTYPEQRSRPTDMLVIALSVSSFFMVLILVVYYWIFPKKMTHVIKIRRCLIVSYICYFITVAIIINDRHSEPVCIALSFIAYFSIMSTCCWLNVMSYDTWLTFRDLLSRNLTPSEKKRRDTLKYRSYLAWGWGLPFCMASALIIINSVDMSGVPWFITPQIPSWGCFLIDGQQLVYQYIPMMVLVLANCVLFVLTAINISYMVNGTEALGPNNKQRQKARLKICLRLSVTMGVSWIWEIISFLVPAADDFASYLDLYNGFIGLLIFIIFVCNRQTLKLIKYRFDLLRGRATSKPAVESQSDSRIQQVPMKRLDDFSSTNGF